MQLPDQLGLEAIVTIQDRSRTIPIMVLTSIEDTSVGLEALRWGAQDYLIKDRIINSDLSRIIRYAIERKRTENRRIADRVHRNTYEVKLRNHKDKEAVTIGVLEHFGGEWEILNEILTVGPKDRVGMPRAVKFAKKDAMKQDPEVVVGSSGYFLHAYDGCGREPDGWPKFTGQWILATPAVGDLDGDDLLEVAIVTRTGWLYLWRTEGRSDGQVQWESFHHDNRNTGNYDEPLDQGDPSRMAAEPITVELCKSFMDVEATPVKLEPAGGCGCEVAGATPDHAPARWLALIGLLGLTRWRRRGRTAGKKEVRS